MSSVISAIELYLIRHGIAAERGTYVNDDDRPLTPVGQTKTRAMADRLREQKLFFDTLVTSPLVRARETAAILQGVGLAAQVEIWPELTPDRAIDPWLERYDQWRTQHLAQAAFPAKPSPRLRLALVGHEPTLSQWANQLIWGDGNPINDARDTIVLKKAGIIGLILPPMGSPLGCSQLFWLTPPRLFL
ncbi:MULTISPECIES: phosphohistidine phosphatase SixA [Limnothrix]|uniref:Phosphohistidine phosphatase SixA n=2 Tax=Limnothrix TaxID=132605 RepID=A0ABW7CBH7_9CYAN|nr:phosphohistidine phosphatase SixA [Limnothrix sp. FACHB-1083]MBD2161454.1 phosphohistidine phosphatase SixA [Limnothrix sp. FACHB-1083]MBD2192035.1 phosphohistidine phosphatase SixA [Limnothrix sp. FACHB-1088]